MSASVSRLFPFRILTPWERKPFVLSLTGLFEGITVLDRHCLASEGILELGIAWLAKLSKLSIDMAAGDEVYVTVIENST